MVTRAIWSTFVLVSIIPLDFAAPQTVQPQTVTLTTFDEQTLYADYYPRKADEGGTPFVILLHMYRGDRSAFVPLIDPLHRAGFAVLALDLRGHGQSATEETRARATKGETALFRDMTRDVRAAYDWLADQPGIDRARFALVGASIGASVALEYAAEDRSVDALVLLSPGTDYLGINSETSLRNVKGRELLMIAADNEKEKAAIHALKNFAKDAKTEIVPGDYHGTHMFGKIPGIEKRIAEYLKKCVGPHTETTVYGSILSDIYHLPGSGWIDEIKPWNLRYYSSAREAEIRGLRRAKNRGPNDRAPPRKSP